MNNKFDRDEERIKEGLSSIDYPKFVYKDDIMKKIENTKVRKIKRRPIVVAIAIVSLLATVVVASELEFFTKLFERDFGGFKNEMAIIEDKEDGTVAIDNGIEIKAEAVGVTSRNVKLLLSVKDLKNNRITGDTSTKDNIEIKAGGFIVTQGNETFDSENKIKYLPIESFFHDDFDGDNIKVYIDRLYTPIKKEEIDYKINLDKIEKIDANELVEIGVGEYRDGMLLGWTTSDSSNDPTYGNKVLKPDVIDKDIEINGVLWKLSNMALEDNRLRIQFKIKTKDMPYSQFQPASINSEYDNAEKISFYLKDGRELNDEDYSYSEYIFELDDLNIKDINIKTYLGITNIIEGNWELKIPVDINSDKLSIENNISMDGLNIENISIDPMGYQLKIREDKLFSINKEYSTIGKEILPFIIEMKDGTKIDCKFSYGNYIEGDKNTDRSKENIVYLLGGEFKSSIDIEKIKSISIRGEMVYGGH